MRRCVKLTKAQARKMARVTTSSDTSLTELIQLVMSGRCLSEDQAHNAEDELRTKITGASSLHKQNQIIRRLWDVQRALSQSHRDQHNYSEEEM